MRNRYSRRNSCLLWRVCPAGTIIFFCIQDIPIHEGLIEKLMQNNYRNHLAHIYIYAYDNRPEMVARAYRSEASLLYFSKGVALAKEIGNEQLVYDAYQKNIMLASTNGMNEIAMLYSVRTYQFMKSRDDVYEGRILSGIGYNLSAMGKKPAGRSITITVPLRCFTICVFQRILRKCFTTVH